MIEYFNKHVVKRGDLVFALWREIKRRKISELSHFWADQSAARTNTSHGKSKQAQARDLSKVRDEDQMHMH